MGLEEDRRVRGGRMIGKEEEERRRRKIEEEMGKRRGKKME